MGLDLAKVDGFSTMILGCSDMRFHPCLLMLRAVSTPAPLRARGKLRQPLHQPWAGKGYRRQERDENNKRDQRYTKMSNRRA